MTDQEEPLEDPKGCWAQPDCRNSCSALTEDTQSALSHPTQEEEITRTLSLERNPAYAHPPGGSYHARALAVANLWVEPGQCPEDPAQSGYPNAVHVSKAGVAGHGAEQVLLDLSGAMPPHKKAL